MGKQKIKPNYRRRVLRLPDLDHCRLAVLNSLGSPASRRVYEYAIQQFIAWYCSEPRLALNRIVVVRYRMYLESRGLAANTINQQLAAVRRLAHEAADSGLLSPELAAGISRVKGVKQLGFRSGNWLSAEQSSEVLKHACGDSMRAKRDYAMLAMLFGCGFRRSELVGLELDEIQMRQGHWAVVDLVGKGGHIRTVPIPDWVKASLDQWTAAARVSEGGESSEPLPGRARCGESASRRMWCGTWSRAVARGRAWSTSHPTTCAEPARSLCHSNGDELEQIQFLLGHASVQTTERYLGCKQNLGHPVNDLFDLGTDASPQEKRVESATTKGPTAVAMAHRPGIECGRDRLAVPDRLKDQILRSFQLDDPMFAYCIASSYGDREQLQSMDPLDHRVVHRNRGVAAFALGSSPIAAAVTLINRDRVLSEIVPSQTSQFGYPQSSKDGHVNHRGIGLRNLRRKTFKLLRG